MPDFKAFLLLLGAFVVIAIGVQVHTGRDAECTTDTECDALDYGTSYFGGIKVPSGFTLGE